MSDDEVLFSSKRPIATDGKENAPGKSAKNKTLEQQYQKKSQIEHILLRPDTFIGSVEKTTERLWVVNGANGLEMRDVVFVPGLFKIFDEILVNALDNRQRDPSMDRLDVVIDQVNGLVSVMNNGRGIPVEIHKEEKMYIPEMIFGHLLTGSNYDDTEERTTGGRNGYGAKLTNIFSTQFEVETADHERGRKFHQVFKNNMSYRAEPSISNYSKNEDYTKITFKPDFAKFGMTHLEGDIAALMKKRVYDAAGTNPKLRVTLNGERLGIKSFEDYCALYLHTRIDKPRFHEVIDDRWEILVSISDGQFEQVSFVNGICTTKGGSHVNYICDQITKQVVEHVSKKNKAAPLKPFQVKNYLSLFVNAKIVNPSFDSQTKEALTTTSSKFGSKPVVSEALMKKLVKSSLIEEVLNFARFKSDSLLKKNDGAKKERVLGIPKLDDANNAGGKHAQDCTLIITEGDSAKSLAVAGLSVVGRDNYGVFPLRGKLLNVREATHTQITENAEINNLKKILGLKHGTVYTDTKSLRYGHLMIMTDQDQDGSHIKGLIINFLHHFWPSLLQVPGFLCEFITPIVKCSRKNEVMSFYTLPEYQNWKDSLDGNTKGWTIKYYKGLGTSTSAEAKEYFTGIERHRIFFEWSGEENARDIELAFSRKLADARKEWMRSFIPGTYLDQSVSHVNYSEFINKELILFSLSDNVRSIPSLMDGLKPGQRKILFSCFKRKLRGEIKVAQLVGYVAEHSAYHHGEVSLMSTVIGMAQDYVGSNNINLLQPLGQFGSRAQGGKDAASARYIFTNLAAMTRLLFPELDDPVLNYLDDDGQSIEPEWYAPVIPTVLVNGAEGIGTGWSTSVPCYNPLDVIANVRRMLAGEEMSAMTPWYRGFYGTIEPTPKDASTFVISGVVNKTSDTTLEITELPIGTWTQNYKEFLEGLMTPQENKDAGKEKKDKEAGAGGDKAEKAESKPEKASSSFMIQGFTEHHTETRVHFKVRLSAEAMREAETVGLAKKFRLTTSCSTSNMMLFDSGNRIQRFDRPTDVIRDFYHSRLRVYENRRRYMLGKLTEEYERLDGKVRFVRAVIGGQLKISNRKKTELIADLLKQGFKPMAKETKAQAAAGDAANENDGAEDADASSVKGGSFDYLLGMSLWSLTAERVAQLEAEMAECEKKLDKLSATTKEMMWLSDIENLENAVTAFLEECDARAQSEKYTQKKTGGAKLGGNHGRKAAPKKKRMDVDDSEDDMDGFDDDEDDDFFDDDDDDYGGPSKKKAPAKAASKAVSKPAVAASAATSRPLATLASTVGASGAASTTTRKLPGLSSVITVHDDAEDSDDAPIGVSGRGGAAAKKPAAAVKRPISSTTSAAVPQSTRPAAAAAAPIVIKDEDDGDFSMSLMDRLAMLNVSKPVASAAVAKPASPAVPAAKRPKNKASTVSAGVFGASAPAVSAAAVPKPKAAAKKPAKKRMSDSEDEDDDDIDLFSDDDDDDFFDDDDDDSGDFGGKKKKKPATAAVAKKAPAAVKKAVPAAPAAAPAAAKGKGKGKAPAAKKSKKMSDDEFDDDDDDSDDDAPLGVSAAGSRSKRATKPIKYNFDEDDEDDDEDW